ncbi:DUF4199 domain-containing protein [Algoriphagus sp. H41]|uniref:DUF4199 domain-containing protein n=1 Tax=Algoriphagus oliviformis TaxID=2811231 RepID=A0ABS3C2Q9_9BACT|nr:DUF4199 domain-containing protein [Algoriphagus oliviformis]MBN7811408.1 DUF4199 domain-containing protein [Algoriphagus oliviformis]
MTKYLKSAYQFGILGGILSVVSFCVLSFLYPDPTNLNLLFGYFLVPVAVFLAIKFFKDGTNGGYLSFAEGMTVGFVTYALLGLLSILGIWLVLSVSPDLFGQIKAQKLEVLAESSETIISQLGEASYSSTQNSMEKMSPWDVALNDGLWKIVPGMFFSIIISIIFRKNPN